MDSIFQFYQFIELECVIMVAGVGGGCKSLLLEGLAIDPRVCLEVAETVDVDLCED